MSEINLPGILPDIFKIIISFLNPWQLILINKEFKRYFYNKLIKYLGLYSVDSWDLILPSTSKFKGELLEIKNSRKILSNMSSTPYINFLEKLFLKLPETFFSIIYDNYPAYESVKIFNLCGNLLSYKQLLVLPILLKNGSSLPYRQNDHLRISLKRESSYSSYRQYHIVQVLSKNIDTIFTTFIPELECRICDVIFGSSGIINSRVYRWPKEPTEFIKCLFIMHLEFMFENNLTIKPYRYPSWALPLIKLSFEQYRLSLSELIDNEEL